MTDKEYFKRTAVLSVLILFLLFQHQARADKICTEMGCENGVHIDVPLDYRWAPGKYQFLFTLDKSKIKCEGKLPLLPCGSMAIQCDKKGILITESGCALPQGAHGFGIITIYSFPYSLKLEIKRNGKRIAQLGAKPSYTESTPNGPECEPRCRQAQLSLDLKRSQ